MLHVIERASSGRARCRACGEKIASGELRLGERLPNPYGDDGSEMTLWFHVVCGALTRPEPFLTALDTAAETIAGREALEGEARRGVAHRRLPRARAAGRAPTGRAMCRACRQPIERGTWRISLAYYEDGRFVPSGFIHVRCAPAYLETPDVMARIRHFSPGLSDAEIAEIQAELGADLSA
jgi:hypothetical protein